jgi:mRNA-degrading endonuclease RelE of RelBE toxin-antitoxin system
MTSTITLEKRSNKQLRKLSKEYTTLNDDEIKEELQKEDSTEYERVKDD